VDLTQREADILAYALATFRANADDLEKMELWELAVKLGIQNQFDAFVRDDLISRLRPFDAFMQKVLTR